MKKQLFAVVVFLVILVLSACSPKVGETATIRDDGTKVVEDWNVPSQIKPIACTLSAGDKVEVLQYDTLILGSSQQETVVQIRNDNCEGWVFLNDIK